MPVAHRPFAVAEVAIAMSLTIGCCWLIRPMDPLLLSFDFPWIWMFATVFALRYGALLGMAAGLSILGAWLILYQAAPENDFPVMVFAGGFVQLLIAGHFADIWHSRRRRCQAEKEYLQQRLTSLTNNHYLLRVSHDRLEKEAFFGASTLRESLNDIRRLCSGDIDGKTLPGAQTLLQFLADACKITNASIYAVGPEGPSRSPLASIGVSDDLDVHNPLLRQCLQTGELSHIGDGRITQNAYLVCVPITSTSGRLLGVMVVRDMVFEALNAANLQFLLALLAYYGGVLDDRRTVMEILSDHPTCPHHFATELGRLGHLARSDASLPSYMAAIQIHDQSSCWDLDAHIQCAEREGASVWRRETAHTVTFIVLHPIVADPESLKTQWEASLADIGGRCEVLPVNPAVTDLGLGDVLSGLINNG